MKTSVFLSWSGPRSRRLARELNSWLPRVIQSVEPWMSDVDIQPGDRWAKVIGESLSRHQFGIICATPENMGSPWLMFEAGSLAKFMDDSRIVPIAFGMRPSDVAGPLAQFQCVDASKDGFHKLIRVLNELTSEASRISDSILNNSFEQNWNGLSSQIKKIARVKIPGTAESISAVINMFSANGFPNPIIGSTAYFREGFESHKLYDVITGNCKKRLLILGRKNRKLFDKEHASFFVGLQRAIDRGFDFRCLFLDPQSPNHIVESAHADSSFKQQLNQSISNAKSLLADYQVASTLRCRKYRTHRTVAVIVVDNSVLYAPIRMDESGHAKLLTKCSFTITPATSSLGSELINGFEELWEESRPV